MTMCILPNTRINSKKVVSISYCTKLNDKNINHSTFDIPIMFINGSPILKNV